MGKGAITGKAFLEGVLSKITDPELKTAAEKAFGSELILTEIGNGVEGQAEIDRQLQSLTQKQQEADQRKADLDGIHVAQVEWYDANKAALEDYKTLKASGVQPSAGDKGKVSDGALTKADLDAILVNERASFLGYQRDQQKILREHYDKFKEVVDIEPLLLHPQVAQLGLVGVYEAVHKDRLTQHATDKAKAAEELIRVDERQKIQSQNANLPYPVPTGPGSGSPLDALTATGKPDSVVDQATAHYQRLQHERAAGTRV